MIQIYKWLFCPFYHRRGTVPCPHSAAAAAPVGLRRVLPSTGRRTIRGEKMVKHGGNRLENGRKRWNMVWAVETCWNMLKHVDEFLIIFSDWTSHDFFAGPCGLTRLHHAASHPLPRRSQNPRMECWISLDVISFGEKNNIKYKVKSILSRSLQILHQINHIWLQKG